MPFPCQGEWLQVSSLHRVYFEVIGNPNGKWALFLHGGPGSGCPSWSKEIFDLHRYKVVLLDQRGSGKSTPNSEIEENTTQLLIEDIEAIRKKLEIKSWFLLFGGSWGSCLLLSYLNYIYSDIYQEKVTVSNVLMYGVFLGRQSEVESTYSPSGPAAQLYPDAYYDFYEPIRLLYSNNKPPKAVWEVYNDIFCNVNNLFTQEQIEDAVMRWSQWESRISSATRTKKEWKELDEAWKTNLSGLRSHSILENHYFINHCFQDGNLFLQREFAEKLGKANINNIKLLAGRFDVVCPPSTAFALQQSLESSSVHSSLEIIDQSGHTAKDSGNRERILEIINKEFWLYLNFIRRCLEPILRRRTCLRGAIAWVRATDGNTARIIIWVETRVF